MVKCVDHQVSTSLSEILADVQAGKVDPRAVIRWATAAVGDSSCQTHPSLLALASLFEHDDDDLAKVETILEELASQELDSRLSAERMREYEAASIAVRCGRLPVTRANCLELMLGICPNAAAFVRRQFEMSRCADPGIYGTMSAFAAYILEMISAYNSSELKCVSEAIESLLKFGDRDVCEATVVGLLEGLTNRCINNHWTNEMALFIECLGPHGQRACRDLDEFWGNK